MNANELRLKSEEIANQARNLLNTITDENRGEKEAEFDRMMVDADAYAARSDRMADAEARSREWSAIATDIPTQNVEVEARATDASDEETRSAAITDYLRGDFNERELRAAGVATDAGGGFLVPKELSPNLIQKMKAYGPLNEGGPVNVLVTASGNPLSFPTNDDTAGVGYAIAENTVAADTDMTFGQISLGAYKYTSRVFKVSSELLADSAINVVDVVNDAMAERLGRSLNNIFTIGTGTNEPQGIVTGATVGVTAAAANGFTYDELIDLEHSVDPAYRENGSYKFSDGYLRFARKLKDGEGRYIWTPANGPLSATINGRPYYINNAMAAAPGAGVKGVLFGDLTKFTVRRAGSVVVRRLNERYADADQVGFVAFVRVDSKVMDNSAIKLLVHP